MHMRSGSWPEAGPGMEGERGRERLTDRQTLNQSRWPSPPCVLDTAAESQIIFGPRRKPWEI